MGDGVALSRRPRRGGGDRPAGLLCRSIGVDANRTVAKVGFDLTRPLNQPDTIENRRAFPRRIGDRPARHQNARQALENGPLYFAQIMDLLASKDGREVALELDELREQGVLSRLDDGQWTLKTDAKG